MNLLAKEKLSVYDFKLLDIDNNNVRVTLKYSISMMGDSLDELTFTTIGGTLVEEGT